MAGEVTITGHAAEKIRELLSGAAELNYRLVISARIDRNCCFNFSNPPPPLNPALSLASLVSLRTVR